MQYVYIRKRKILPRDPKSHRQHEVFASEIEEQALDEISSALMALAEIHPAHSRCIHSIWLTKKRGYRSGGTREAKRTKKSVLWLHGGHESHGAGGVRW